MSLNWDVSKVADYKKMQETESGITDAVIWLTMAVGLGEITEKNVEEFARRAALVQMLNGSWLVRGIYVTEDMIRRRIGLHTNVSDETWAAWSKRYLSKRDMVALADREIERQRAESERIMADLDAERKEVSA
jgi:hypothetical protein